MIIIVCFFLLCLGDYMGSKLDITPSQLDNIAFSFGHSVFLEIAIEADLQAAIFVTLTSTTKNNGIRGEKIGHKDSG